MLADIAARLSDRAARAGLRLPDDVASRLVVYLEVLLHWNAKINLTSLSDPDEAVDRLLLEPVAAAPFLPAGATLIDLGSGGGSPAIPLALCLGSPRLVMVESRLRKAAFLREAAREAGVEATVESARFEAVADDSRYARGFEALSARAVRLDEAAFDAIAKLLRPSGVAALFRGPGGSDRIELSEAALKWRATTPLLKSTKSRLTLIDRP